MISLVVLYLLALASGLLIERRLAINDVVKRTLFVVCVAAAQITLTVQVVSLFRALTGSGLLLCNVVLAAGVWTASRLVPDCSTRVSWAVLLGGVAGRLRLLRQEPLAAILLGCSLAYVVCACAFGLMMIPFGDLYHNEMPLYWIQNRTIVPFPVDNPRIVAVTFLGEALALPGYLYARTPVLHAVVTFLGMLLGLGVVFSLARRLGAGRGASLCAGALIAGFTSWALEPLYALAGDVLAGALFGASLLFLLDFRSSRLTGSPRATDAVCSLLCFSLACAGKNTTALLGPFYAVAFLVAAKRLIWSPRMLLSLALFGGLGFAASGVPWSYLNNQLWFGHPSGPPFMQGHVSHDYAPRSVWTRLCRGGVLMMYDTLWIPGSAKAKYEALCEKTALALGAKGSLVEDNEFSNFGEKARTPRKGLGLLGIAIFLPALGAGALRWLGVSAKGRQMEQSQRFACGLLVLMTFGAFLMAHAVLRWQMIGLLRLMLPFVICGAPLCAMLLEGRWPRFAALVLFVISAGMFAVYFLGMGWRHLNITGDNKVFRTIARLQNSHARPVQYTWSGQSPGEFTQEEDYSMREVYQKLLSGITQPCVIGTIGHANTEAYYLFGPKFKNRVVPLLDCRAPERLADPSPEIDYLLAVDRFEETEAIAERIGFKPLFQAHSEGRTLLKAFGRNRP